MNVLRRFHELTFIRPFNLLQLKRVYTFCFCIRFQHCLSVWNYSQTCSQFHQHFTCKFFEQTLFCQLFSSYMYLEKVAETTFEQKIRM